MENSVGTFRTDRLMQGDRPSQVTVNTGSTVLAFFGSSIPTSLLIFKMFFHSCLLFLCNIANVAQRTFKIVQKSSSREYN